MLSALGSDTGTQHLSGLGDAIRELQKFAEPLQSLVRMHLSTTSEEESTRLKEFYIAVADLVMGQVSGEGCAKLKAYSLHIHTSLKLLGCGSFLIFVGGIVRYVRIAGSSGIRTGMVLRIFRNCARTQTYFSGVCTCCLQAACPATLRADLTVVGDCATGRVMRLTINFRELVYISTTGLISRHSHFGTNSLATTLAKNELREHVDKPASKPRNPRLRPSIQVLKSSPFCT